LEREWEGVEGIDYPFCKRLPARFADLQERLRRLNNCGQREKMQKARGFEEPHPHLRGHEEVFPNFEVGWAMDGRWPERLGDSDEDGSAKQPAWCI